MAGATNRAMKAAGLPRKTQETVRVALGAGMTVQSAIRHAAAHGLPLGKAKGGNVTGWDKAAAGATTPAEHRAAHEAHAASRKAAMLAARQNRVAGSLDAAGKRMLTGRMVSAMMSRQLAAQQAADAQKAAQTERQNRVAGALGAASKGMLTARKERAEAARRGKMAVSTSDRKEWVRDGVREHIRQVTEANARRAAAPNAPTVHLQSIGKTPAKKGGEIKAGDTLVYNFGSTAKVTGVRDHSAKFVMVTMESGGKSYTQKMGRDRLVAYDPRGGGAAAKPAMTGARPFNADRHLAKAQNLMAKRLEQATRANETLARVSGNGSSESVVGKADSARWKAVSAKDRARELLQSANARVGARDRAERMAQFAKIAKTESRAKENAALPRMAAETRANMAAGRATLASAKNARAGMERIVTQNGNALTAKTVKPVATNGDLFVHKAEGGGYGVTHRPTGATLYQSHSVTAARAVMDGAAKSGSKVLSRIEKGDLRAMKALYRYNTRSTSAKFFNAAHARYNG